MEGGGRRFSGSEEFARSLEPRYPSVESNPEPRPAHARPSFSVPRLQRPERQPRSAHHEPLPAHVRAHHHRRRKRFEVFAAAYLLFLLVLVMFLSASTDTGPFIVFLSFLPTLFTVVIAMVVYEAAKDNKNILWGIPLILIFGFWWVGNVHGGLVGNIDVSVMTGLNILFSFLYLVVNYFLLQSPMPKEPAKVKVVERVVEKEVIPEDLSKFIASIEDKGKALNFVIGRVYNAYHGGTKELRNKVNMKQEWYDQFSQLPEDSAKIDFVALNTLISTIESRLHLLEKRERDIFGDAAQGFKNLVRDPLGNDKIIDVLDKNDKDPVKTYVDGALQFCGKAKDYIGKQQALGVKNEYVPRDDEEKKSAPRSSWSDKGALEK